MKHFKLVIFLAIGLTACQDDEPNLFPLDKDLIAVLEETSDGIGKDYYKLPDNIDFESIPQDPLNPLTAEKVKLGQLLYHETDLGQHPQKPEGLKTFSCASCHHAGAGFQAGSRQGLGDGGMGFGVNGEARALHPNYNLADIDVQPVRSPSTLNSAYQKNHLWNGQFGATGENIGTEANWTEGTPIATNHLGYEGVEIQAIAGLKVHRMEINPDYIQDSEYKTLFDEAFPTVNFADRYTTEMAGLAIAAYERTLMANQAPFQDWLDGDIYALSVSQKKGAILFFDKAQCANCHNGPALNSMSFHALGMGDLLGEGVFRSDANDNAHKGRGGFTGNEADMYKFKTPQLYNIKDSPFYGHGGTFRTVEEVIRYKNNGLPQNQNVPSSQLSEDFKPLNLTDTEIKYLTDFIENGLHDASLTRYKPASVLSGNCFPNNDDLSKADMGCE